MTARGELLVDEDVRDFVRDDLEKSLKQKFGDKLIDWRIDGSGYGDVGNESQMPNEGDAPIIGEFKDGEKEIGKVWFKMKFSVGGDGFDRYVEGDLADAGFVVYSEPKNDCGVV